MRTLILFFAPLLAFAGCSDEKEPATEGDDEEHAHAAKHGGALLTLGEHEGFIEVKVYHDAGTLALWVYVGEEMKPGSLDSAPVLNMKTDNGPIQLTGKGSGDTWTFSDQALKGEPEGARFLVALGGKSYSPEWAHSHEGHEDHDEDEGHEDHEGHDEDEVHKGHDHEDGDEHEGCGGDG